MALPGSGQLSLGNIANEQAISLSNISLRSMSSTAGFSTPDAVSEFYGYSALTYTYIADYAADDPCFYDYKPIYIGSDGVYYTQLGFSYYPMFSITQFWYEFQYYEPLFPANVYTQWEIDSTSTTLTDNGYFLSSC